MLRVSEPRHRMPCMKSKTFVALGIHRSFLVRFIVVVVLLLAVFGIYNFRLALIEYNTRIVHLYPLSHAVENFDQQYERLPTSLKEVVRSGALPSVSTIYCSPMQQSVLNPRQPISFQQCEFQMDFTPAVVSICVPEAVWRSRWCWSRTDGAHHGVKIFHSAPPPK